MIIPVYKVVSSQFPIATTTTNIEAGMPIYIDSNGQCLRCDASDVPIGLAGDRTRASEALEWTNRVSDAGNDTAASGMLTVYHSGGEFWVDVDDSSITTPGGTSITGVVVSLAATIADLAYTADNGQIDDSGTNVLGNFLTGEVTVESGIPGEYEPGSSVDYADDDTPRKWAKIKLTI